MAASGREIVRMIGLVLLLVHRSGTVGRRHGGWMRDVRATEERQ